MLRSLLLLGWSLAICAFSVQAQFVFDSPSDPGDALEIPPLGGVSSPTLTDDEKELYLASTGDIWRSTRTSTGLPFKEAFRNSRLSTVEYIEESPFLSPDGLRIYFTRRESAFTKVREIFVASRPDRESPFGDPVSLGPDGPVPFEGHLGSLTGDELTVFLDVFPSSKEKAISDQTDIAVATRPSLNDRFGPWQKLEELNTDDIESSPFITRDGRSIFISRVRTGLPGGILAANRADSTSSFSEPALVKGLNVANKASKDPYLIHPGSRMYFVLDNQLVFSDRILDATYVLEQVTARQGREFWVPVKMQTREKDATLFEFLFFFTPQSIDWLEEVIPNERLGLIEWYVEPINPSILSVRYQAAHPLRGNGEEEEILTLHFAVKSTAPAGMRQYGLTGTAKLNGVPITPLPTSFIDIQGPPARPFTSILMLR